jgi:hypothetical protein
MSKSILKDGMKVVFRNGKESIVLNGKFVNMRGGFFSLDRYDKDLKNKDVSDFDVVNILKFEDKMWVEVVEKKFDLCVPECFTVHIQDVKTTVTLVDGTKATTTCLPEDMYDENTGISIAYTKAVIKSYTKLLKELTK